VAEKKKLSPEMTAFAKQFLGAMNVDAAELTAEDEREEERAGKQLKSEAARQSKEQHYWVQVIRMPDDNESHIFVGAAGVAYQLAKGVKVPVPKSVLNALSMARVDGFVPIIDDQTGMKKQARVSYDRYPLQIFGECSLAEVKAWRDEEARKSRERTGIVDAPNVEVLGRPSVEYGNPEKVLSD